MTTKAKRTRRNTLYVELPDKVNEMFWLIMDDEASEPGSFVNASDVVRKMIREEFKRRKLSFIEEEQSPKKLSRKA